MLTLLIASVLAVRTQPSAGSPIVVNIKGFVGDPIIALSIDGKPPVDFGLTMTTRHSIVMNKDDAGTGRKLSVEGKTVASVELEAPAQGIHPVLNALGLSVLNGMAIGVDYAKNQITFWPGGRLTEEEADAWIMRAPKWTGESKVWKTKIERRAEVAPVLPMTIGGKKMDLLLRIGREGSSFAKGEEPSSGTPIEYGPGGNHAILPDVTVGSQKLPWILYFRGVSYDPKKAIDPSITGTFTTENLLARRMILDLSANVLYCEQLPPDAQLSLFLTEWFQLPFEVQGSKVFLREMPGTKFFAQFSSIYDSEVLEIMGQPIETVLEAARDFTGDHRTLLKVLFEKVWQGFKVKIKRPNGSIVEISLDPPK